VHETLRQGIYGWQVADCTVSMTHSGYSSVSSTAGDFRHLTPLVLMSALKQAGTVVCEPMHRFNLDIPPTPSEHARYCTADCDVCANHRHPAVIVRARKVSAGISRLKRCIGSQTTVPACFSALINTSGVRWRKSPAVLDTLL